MAVGPMAVGPMVEVGHMRDMEVELAVRLVVQFAASLVAKFAVVALTDTHRWGLLAVAVIMHQRPISMWGKARGSSVCGKLASPGLSIGVAASYR